MTILIRGGTVVNHDHSWRADVLVDGDKIVGFGPSLSAPAIAALKKSTPREPVPRERR